MRRSAGGIRSLGSATSMTTRMAGAILAVSLISLTIATIVGLGTGESLGRDLYEDRLRAMRSSAAGDVEAHIGALVRTAEALAFSPQAARATELFADGVDEAGAIPPEQLEAETEAVVESYQTSYIDPLRESGRELSLRSFVAFDPAAIHLQYLYGVDIAPARQPSSVADARDGSSWSTVHAEVHPVYLDVVNRRDLVDLYLVDPDDGKVVYSVQKRPDLATSLDSGPFSGSVLSNAVERVIDDPEAGTVVSDLRAYDPMLRTPVGVIASPVLDGSRLVGIVALMYDSPPLTELLTADQQWEEAGFPETGETYLVGADGRLRSDPRSYLEEPETHLDLAAANGLLNDDERSVIEVADTTVLTQRAVGTTVAAAEEVDETIEKRATIVGGEAFSTVTPIGIDDLGWTVAAEIGAEAAEGDVDDFQELLVVGSAVFIVILAFVAVAWANGIVAPVRMISDRLGSRDDRDDPVVIPERSPVEFHQLATSFEEMARALREREDQLEQARDDRVALLRRLLPRTAAERVANGAAPQVEDVADTSVVVAVIRGLDEPVEAGGGDRALVDRLLGELDQLADDHGLERVKVLGDAYFAACGHDRPYIDHAPRAFGFALDARRAIDRAIDRRDPGSRSSVAVDSGVVTVGMAGGTRLVFDVWGETVSHAHQLARRAQPGTMMVSDETRRRLPDDIPLIQVDDDAWRLAFDEDEGAP